MKIHWYYLGGGLDEKSLLIIKDFLTTILTLLAIPSLIGVALLRIFIDDICTIGSHQGDKRRFRRIVG